MRVFIKYDQEGKIISVSKVNLMPEELENPYGDLTDKEQVLEVTETEEIAQLDAIQIHSNYRVDIQSKKLVPHT